MKKMLLIMSLALSVSMLASCASKGTTADNTTIAPVAPAQTAGTHAHHRDYKGEVK